MAAVRVPPSACSTSQSMLIEFSPSADRSIAARSERPMSREISCVRPPILPRTDSRSFRVSVARGSIEYSAVTQPRPLPLRQRGTPCCTDAEQSTLVSPKLINADPSAYFCQSRSIETGRSWSLVRASGRGMASRVVAASGRPGRPGQDGGMRTETFDVRTGGSPRVHDLTRDCASFVSDEHDGLLNVFVPHATAGVAILETGAGSDDDLLAAIDDMLPRDARWRHAPRQRRARPRPRAAGVHRAVGGRPRRRWPAAAGHLAVHLPRRHQRRQQHPDRAARASSPG